MVDFVDTGLQRISYADFKNGCYMYEVVYDKISAGQVFTAVFSPVRLAIRVKRKYSYDESAQRALAELNSGSHWSYDVLENNCEHFATWVVMGKKYSVQADRAKTGLMSDITGVRGMSLSTNT